MSYIVPIIYHVKVEKRIVYIILLCKFDRWWCDCTASWREKWSKVRAERNKSRDECKRLRNKLESFAKDCSTLKKEKEQLNTRVDDLKTHLSTLEIADNKDITNVRASGINVDTSSSSTTKTTVLPSVAEATSTMNSSGEPGAAGAIANVPRSDLDLLRDTSSKISDEKLIKENLLMQQKVSMLTHSLEEAQQTIQAERQSVLLFSHLYITGVYLTLIQGFL